MPPFLKLLVPAAGIAFILWRFGRRPILADAFRVPSARSALSWLALYLAWMFGTDAAMNWRGGFDFTPWQQAPLLHSALRVLAVCFAGPALEELVFRGLIFGALLGTRLGAAGTIVLTALAWSLLHWSYLPAVIAVIAVQGLILGAARWRTGSVLLPIGLHMLWNLYAVW